MMRICRLVSPPNVRRPTPAHPSCLAAMPTITMRGAECKSNCTITPGILSARDRSVLSYRIKRKAPEGAAEPCRTGTAAAAAVLPESSFLQPSPGPRTALRDQSQFPSTLMPVLVSPILSPQSSTKPGEPLCERKADGTSTVRIDESRKPKVEMFISKRVCAYVCGCVSVRMYTWSYAESSETK